MARLPTPGGDEGNWGEVLNNYLSTSLDTDGTIKSSALSSKEDAGTAAARTRAGTLANRPSATGLADGVRYFATDDQGGTEYVISSGAWVQVAPAVSGVSGQVLTSVWPSSVAALSVGATAVRVPELTTPAFEVPNRPVRVVAPQLAANIPTGNDVTAVLSFDRNNAGTYAAATVSLGIQFTPNTVALARWGGHSFPLPSVFSAGDTARVAMFVSRANPAADVTIACVPAFGIVFGIDVITF